MSKNRDQPISKGSLGTSTAKKRTGKKKAEDGWQNKRGFQDSAFQKNFQPQPSTGGQRQEGKLKLPWMFLGVGFFCCTLLGLLWIFGPSGKRASPCRINFSKENRSELKRQTPENPQETSLKGLIAGKHPLSREDFLETSNFQIKTVGVSEGAEGEPSKEGSFQKEGFSDMKRDFEDGGFREDATVEEAPPQRVERNLPRVDVIDGSLAKERLLNLEMKKSLHFLIKFMELRDSFIQNRLDLPGLEELRGCAETLSLEIQVATRVLTLLLEETFHHSPVSLYELWKAYPLVLDKLSPLHFSEKALWLNKLFEWVGVKITIRPLEGNRASTKKWQKLRDLQRLAQRGDLEGVLNVIGSFPERDRMGVQDWCDRAQRFLAIQKAFQGVEASILKELQSKERNF